MAVSKKTLQDTMNRNNFGACFFSLSFNHLPDVVSFKKQDEYQGIYTVKPTRYLIIRSEDFREKLIRFLTREGQPGGKTRQVLQEIEATVK